MSAIPGLAALGLQRPYSEYAAGLSWSCYGPGCSLSLFFKGCRGWLADHQSKTVSHRSPPREKQDRCSTTTSHVASVRLWKLDAGNLFQNDEPQRPESAKVDTKQSVLPFGNIP